LCTCNVYSTDKLYCVRMVNPKKNGATMKYQLNSFRQIFLYVCLVSLTFNNAYSGSLETAKALFAKKEYVKALKTLEPELEKIKPSVASLRLGLDSAMKSGRILTASTITSKLLEATGSSDPAILFRGGEIAEMIGNNTLALSRYLKYTEVANTKNAPMKKALSYLIHRGAYIDAYKKYVKLFGADAFIWSRGYSLMQHTMLGQDQKVLFPITTLMLKSFKSSPYRINELGHLLYNHASYFKNWEVKLNYFRVLLPHKLADSWYFYSFYSGIVANRSLSATEKFNFLARIQESQNAALGNTWYLSQMKDCINHFGKTEEKTRDKAITRLLEFEKYYLKSSNKRNYYNYVNTILTMPIVMKANKRVVFQMYKNLVQKYKGEYNTTISDTMISSLLGNCISKDATKIKFLKPYLNVMSSGRFNYYLQLTKYKNFNNDLKVFMKGKSSFEKEQLSWSLLPAYVATKNNALLIKAATSYLMCNPVTFGDAYVAQYFFQQTTIPIAQKIALLKKLHAKTGYTNKVVALIQRLNKIKAWQTNREFLKLRNSLKQGKASDPLMGILGQLSRLNSSKQAAQVLKLQKQFLASYKGAIPSNQKKSTSSAEYMAFLVWNYGASFRSKKDIINWATLFSPRMKKENGEAWYTMTKHVFDWTRGDKGREHSLWEIAKYYSKVLKKGEKPYSNIIAYLYEALPPKSQDVSVMENIYNVMGSYSLYYINRCRKSWTPAFYAKQLVIALSNPKTNFRISGLRTVISDIYNHTDAKYPVYADALNKLLDRFQQTEIAEQCFFYDYEMTLYNAALRGKKNQEANKFLDYWIQSYKKKTALKQAVAGMQFYIKVSGSSSAVNKKVLLNLLAPAFAKITPAEWASVPMAYNCFTGLQNNIKSEKDAKLKQKYVSIQNALTEQLCTGKRWPDSYYGFLRYIKPFLFNLAKKGDWENLLRGQYVYQSCLYGYSNWNDLSNTYVKPYAALLQTSKKNEALYLFLSRLMKHAQYNVKLLKDTYMPLKATLARNIPGLIPVDKKDPLYPLFIAAQALMEGKEEKAWELTRGKLNVFMQKWKSLDPLFVIWTVEQMRKQKLFKEAKKICYTILLNELSLDPEMAANISLIKGDIFREQNNFQAARMEYQGLKNNKRYKKTTSGSLAKYRLIELMILMKDYTNAQMQLERMVDSDNLAEQAEAYYLIAQIAFEQEEYKDASDDLKQVFKRMSNHVKGRLLEGRLKLRLPRGLAHPEVMLGRIDLQKTVVPGKELELKLQDSNLSVARGGKSIPIILSTSQGKDEEKIQLMADSEDPTLFVGKIQTSLGNVTKHNMLLEVSGSDEVLYMIAPEFQKANNISREAKSMNVKSNAKLIASSGQILTQDEIDRQEMNKMMMMQNSSRNRGRAMRNALVVRPGSPIYVQITDLDRDLTNKKDKVTIDLKTSSGDILKGFEVEETAVHSGIFSGKVPTGIPFPLVSTSGNMEGSDPYVMINSKKKGTWSSVPDGRKPKWVEIDTMSSYEIKSVNIKMPNSGNIKKLRLYGALDQDNVLLALYPPGQTVVRGGLTTQSYPSSTANLSQMRTILSRQGADTVWTSQPILERNKYKWGKRNGYYISLMKGTFWLDKNQDIEFKFLQAPKYSNNQYVYLYIDGKNLLGGYMNPGILKRTKKRLLAKGFHTIEVYFRTHYNSSKIIIGYKVNDSFVPLPKKWFSTKDNPKLADLLKPKGKILKTADGFKASLNKPERYRRLRWIFEDFTGNAVQVNKIIVTDAKNKKIIPVTQDFSTGRTNDTLEVAAGDQIEVKYTDEMRLDKNKPEDIVTLSSSFFNGEVELAYEEISEEDNNRTTYSPAKRIESGDTLMCIVRDYDEDISDARDKIKVNISTSSGESLDTVLLETDISDNRRNQHNHAGTFLQIIRFGDKTGKNMLKIAPQDKVIVKYLDKENTSPGVPVERRYTLMSAGNQPPTLQVYRTKVLREEDKSPHAQAMVTKMRNRGDKRKEIRIFKDQIYAVYPKNKDTGKEIKISINAPLLIEAFNPKQAKHLNSGFSLYLKSESEKKAAQAESREPTELKVPMTIKDMSRLAGNKGYPVKILNTVPATPESLLEEGMFSAVVRLQIGGKGDTINDMIDFGVGGNTNSINEISDDSKIPTLLVSGSDTLIAEIRDKAGKVLTSKTIKLYADPKLELMDASFESAMDSIHLGQKFYLRLVDPDHDISDESDTVHLDVKSASGDKMKLELQETIPHSGVFTGFIKPVFVKKDPKTGKLAVPDTKDKVLRVNFGDTVDFSFVDDKPLSSDKPLTVTSQGKIYMGADGEVACFTKHFKDPDMAVKVRFLLAEALFEMGKNHRKLKKIKIAAKEIAEGKRILEEAMRDYPETTLKSQGEFLLANLAQQLGVAEVDDKNAKMKHLQEAIGRYATVISNWPDSEYAIKSQFNKAVCLQKIKQDELACEEFVKLTYLYPDSPLVADATLRLGNYYYKHKKYKIAAKIFQQFQQNNPAHDKACVSLFMSSNSFLRMQKAIEERVKLKYPDKIWKGNYESPIEILTKLIELYPDNKKYRPESMYWLADCYYKTGNYAKAYQIFKKLTWDYPTTKWAKIARGRLTDEAMTRVEENQ